MELIVCSKSVHKLTAAKNVFGNIRGVEGSVVFCPPQPVGDDFLRVTENKAEDVVCAVYRREGRVFCEVGEAVEVPYEFAVAAAKEPHSNAGYSVTVGQLLVQAGKAKDATNWHVDLANVARATQIERVLRRLSESIDARRCTPLDVRANLLYTPDFPKPGVLFKDMSPLFGVAMLRPFVAVCVAAVRATGATVVAGLEARGLALGALIAHELGAGFVMVRKAGKLPPPKETVEYGTEYSRDKLELAASCGVQGGNVLLVDDLIATGGSLLAAAELVRRLGGTVVAAFAPLSVPALWHSTASKCAAQGLTLITLA